MDAHDLERLVADAARRRAEQRAALHEERARAAGRPRRRRNGPSTVFSLRLDHHELEALEAHAARLGLRPSAYARNLIRSAVLHSRLEPDLRTVVEDLQVSVDRLRRHLR